MDHVGENIRKMRAAKGWTQSDLAGIAKIGVKYLASVERGERNAGHKVMAALCEAFAVDEKVIRYGEGDEGRGVFSDEDMEILSALKNDPEKYLLAKQILAMDDESVFDLRVKARGLKEKGASSSSIQQG